MTSTNDKILLVPVPEAGRLLGGLSRTTIYHLVKQGRLTKVNIGSRGFITMNSLTEFVDTLSAEGETQ